MKAAALQIFHLSSRCCRQVSQQQTRQPRTSRDNTEVFIYRNDHYKFSWLLGKVGTGWTKQTFILSVFFYLVSKLQVVNGIDTEMEYSSSPARRGRTTNRQHAAPQAQRVLQKPLKAHIKHITPTHTDPAPVCQADPHQPTCAPMYP
jgi:hypothetical protein